MSRQYTKIPASKPPPRKMMVRPAPKMSALLGQRGTKRGFTGMGK